MASRGGSPFFAVKESVTADDSVWSSPERLVALAIADHMNPKGQAWPSNRAIRAWTRLGETTVRKALRTLCEGPGALFSREQPTAWRSSHTYTLKDEVRQTNPIEGDGVRETNPTRSSGVRYSDGAGAPREGEGFATHGDGVRHATTEVPIEVPTEPPREVDGLSPSAKTNGNDNLRPEKRSLPERVRDHWKARFPGKGNGELTQQDLNAIRQRLKEGQTEQMLLDAVTGASTLPEQVRGKDGKRHDAIADILSCEDKVVRCAAWARKGREDNEARPKRDDARVIRKPLSGEEVETPPNEPQRKEASSVDIQREERIVPKVPA